MSKIVPVDSERLQRQKNILAGWRLALRVDRLSWRVQGKQTYWAFAPLHLLVPVANAARNAPILAGANNV